MEHQLPQLPYAKDALAPHMSAETFDYHYAKHHQAYVTNLNNLIKGTEFENLDLEAIVKKHPAGGVLQQCSTGLEPHLFWNCMKPNGGGAPSGALADAINAKWGTLDAFKAAFQASAVGNFGSGWTWLVKKADGSLNIVNAWAQPAHHLPPVTKRCCVLTFGNTLTTSTIATCVQNLSKPTLFHS